MPNFLSTRRLACVLALALACLAFAPGLDGPFLLDDTMNLLRARAPTGEAADVVDALIRNGSGLLRRPVSNASFLLNYHLIGSSAFAYKSVNLAVHFLLAIALWQLARVLLRWLLPNRGDEAEAVACLTALAWAVHPIQVSTVLYVVQRMAQLSALFSALAVLHFLNQATRLRSEGTRTRAGVVATTGVLLLTLLAVLSKENGALVPVLILAVAACSSHDRLGELWQQPASRLLLLATAVLPVAIGTIGGAVLTATKFSGGYVIRDFTLVERVLTEPFVLAHYLWCFLTGDIRAMGLYLEDIPIRHADDPLAWAALASVLLITIGAVLSRRRYPLAAFAVLWFLGCHAMESTVIPLEIAFEHRNYLAIFGPTLAIVAWAWHGLRRLEPTQAAGLLLIPLLLLAGATLRRSHQWSNANLFTEHEFRNHPESPRAIVQAAALQASMGNTTASLELLRRAQALRPDSFWMKAYDIHIACVDGRSRPDWDALLTLAEIPRNWFGFEEAIRPPARMIVQKQCEGISAEGLDHFLEQLIQRVGTRIPAGKLEHLYILRQQMADAMGDAIHAEAWLRAGIEANPRGTDAVSLLAYRLLNAGRIDEAEVIGTTWRERIERFHRSTLDYEVDEFERYLSQARREADVPAR